MSFREMEVIPAPTSKKKKKEQKRKLHRHIKENELKKRGCPWEMNLPGFVPCLVGLCHSLSRVHVSRVKAVSLKL